MLKKIFIFPIRLYQIIISPIIGGNRCCRFSPTCSSYAIEAFERLGVVKGFIATASRIIRCNPWGGSGFDPVDNFKLKKSKK